MVVNDTTRSNGGTQSIVTPEGYVILLHIRNGLPYMDISKPTQAEIDALPQVYFCADELWEPHSLDDEYVDYDPKSYPALATARRSERHPRMNDHEEVDFANHHTQVINPSPPDTLWGVKQKSPPPSKNSFVLMVPWRAS